MNEFAMKTYENTIKRRMFNCYVSLPVKFLQSFEDNPQSHATAFGGVALRCRKTAEEALITYQGCLGLGLRAVYQRGVVESVVDAMWGIEEI